MRCEVVSIARGANSPFRQVLSLTGQDASQEIFAVVLTGGTAVSGTAPHCFRSLLIIFVGLARSEDIRGRGLLLLCRGGTGLDLLHGHRLARENCTVVEIALRSLGARLLLTRPPERKQRTVREHATATCKNAWPIPVLVFFTTDSDRVCVRSESHLTTNP